jgi:hypothetical protein
LAKSQSVYALGELYRNAIRAYNEGNKQFFNAHFFETKYEIAYQTEKLFSICFVSKEYSGGVYNKIEKSSQTWDLKEMKVLSLDDFFNSQDYIENIVYLIQNQAYYNMKTCKKKYFSDYLDGIEKYFIEKARRPGSN